MPWFQFPLHRDPRCNSRKCAKGSWFYGFSSLYIGILAATRLLLVVALAYWVSVPFTSGSSLQQLYKTKEFRRLPQCFSSLYIGILAATPPAGDSAWFVIAFQFPLHRDPRCNSGTTLVAAKELGVSVPFTSGSSLQQEQPEIGVKQCRLPFQFPLHRDPRCNAGKKIRVEEKRMFQFPLHRDPRCN